MGNSDTAGRASPVDSPVAHRGMEVASDTAVSNHTDRDEATEEPPLVRIAREVWAGRRSYEECHAAFAESIVYARRPSRPGLLVTDVPGRGQWPVVFSRLERLAAYAGECDYLVTTGMDFLDLVPEGVGVMLDPDDQHRFPLLTRVTPASQVAGAWDRLARLRGWATTRGVQVDPADDRQ